MESITCKVCKLNCLIKINKNSNPIEVMGNKCPKGKTYALTTIESRVLRGQVKLLKSSMARLPVHTSGPVHKEDVQDLMDLIAEIEVTGPVKAGQVILKNPLGLDIDLLASRRVASLN